MAAWKKKKYSNSWIPVSTPVIGPKEIRAVEQCLRTGWISSGGKYVEAFEHRWARFCGCRYGVAVTSGTAALQLGTVALRLRPGDEVILPAFTNISCVLAILYNQLIPVLVDSDPETGCIDPSLIEERITPRTRAIMPVHVYGHPADMDPILNLAEKNNLAVIEDAAEAHGAEYFTRRNKIGGQWKRCGSFGAVSCFSFYANKPVTTGEGGMAVTNDFKRARATRSLVDMGFQKRRFSHEELGFNFRMTNLQAAMGFEQTNRISRIIERKKWIGRTYHLALEGVCGIRRPVCKPWARSIYWMYGIVIEKKGVDASGLAKKLAASGIETRPFFLGMHEQPVFRKQKLFSGETYPVAERLARYGLYLPSGLAMTKSQIHRVCCAVRKALS